MTFDHLWSLLDSIQSQVRAFDTKAQVAIGVNGVLIGFVSAEIAKAAEYGSTGLFYRFIFTCVFAGASLCVSLIAIGFAVYVVHPQIELRQPRSHFFFCHIVEKYGRDFDRAVQALQGLSAEEELHEIASQVVSNSIVCDVKGRRCRPTLVLTGCALALYGFSIIPYSSMAFGHTILAATAPDRGNVPLIFRATATPAPADTPKSPVPIWPYAVPVATILGALAGAAVSSFITRRNAKEQNALASRTKLADYREAWLNRLRDAIAEFGAAALSSPSDSGGLNRHRIDELTIKIRLLMNRRDSRYGTLDGILAAVSDRKMEDDPGEFASRLTMLAQDILKTEWEILKYDLEYEPPRVKKSNPDRRS
jgi:hypothetical protein